MFRRSRGEVVERRRSAPLGETKWWDSSDQAVAETQWLTRGELGKGWNRVPMVNNSEHLDPYGVDDASQRLRHIRSGLVLSALDENEIWRRRNDRALVVVRVEVFELPVEPLRRAWQDLAEECLCSLWRQRWTERDETPGWIEVRWKCGSELSELSELSETPEPADISTREAGGSDPIVVDWLEVEDHTSVGADGDVTMYEHLSFWHGRCLVTAVVRHAQSVPLDDVTSSISAVISEQLGILSRKLGLGRGFS